MESMEVPAPKTQVLVSVISSSGFGQPLLASAGGGLDQSPPPENVINPLCVGAGHFLVAGTSSVFAVTESGRCKP
jgi:hypothetical protein